MKFTLPILVSWILGLSGTATAQQDTFNYRSTSGKDYGPNDWDEVSCNNLDSCPGWPHKMEGSIGFELSRNQCRSCPIGGNSCGQHRQSPIDLHRDRAIEGDPNEKECPDWHWMNFKDGSCQWEDMTDQFEISRNGLHLHTPLRNNGDIDCVNENNERKFPKLDYSKGFPDWWLLSRTDISVPSQHVQQGKRYAAEVVLSHFYEIDHYKNKMGHISIFMQDFEGEKAWHYLDKMICQWRKVEEKQRSACGLPPAPVYKMCELYRGQVRGEDDVEAPTVDIQYPTYAPLVAPKAVPIQNLGADPEEFHLPLKLCEGDCDFADDCAEGLLCHRRDAFEEVPGCLGGGSDGTNTDYCVFDPYGEGYFVATPEPTSAPTITARPTLTLLSPRNIKDYGGDPPLDRFPLQYCEGDCDVDEQCAEGLICFQREPYDGIPGCIGGDLSVEKTDFCILDPHGQGYDLPDTDAPTPAPQTEQPTPGPTFPEVPTPAPVSTIAPATAMPVPSPQPSHFPRPGGAPKPLVDLGWEPPLPLGECEGDCDIDDDCGPGLYCFQRNAVAVPVPGCVGGVDDTTLTDFCAYREIDGQPTSVPTTKAPTTDGPTPAPLSTATPTTGPPTTDAPTKAPTDKVLPDVTFDGWTPEEELPECYGDCDVDDDCAAGYICFQRHSGNEAVPGCAGGEMDSSLTDYCIKEINPAPTTPSPATPKPTLSPTGTTKAPTNDADAKPLNNLGWSPPLESKPLKVCEGDCDIDADCGLGLKCDQRYLPYQAVPGCIGGQIDSSLTDYCIVDESYVAVPTASPVTAAPVTEAPATEAPTTKAPASDLSPAPVSEPTPSPVAPTDAPVDPTDTMVPPPINCDDFDDVNYHRMCKEDSCCENPLSSSLFCHEEYAKLGDAVESACYHCCNEEDGGPKESGPPPVENPDFTQLVPCDTTENPERMCKEDSCCEASGSHTDWCQEQYGLFPNDNEVASICWYCCFPSKVVDFDTTRRALAGADLFEEPVVGNTNILNESTETRSSELTDRVASVMSKEQLRRFYKNQTLAVGENDRVGNVGGKTVIVREENFEPKGAGGDEDAYFNEMYGKFQGRELQGSVHENYDDVFWWPYEWLLKVGTEYYFRYEGTQVVPPCFDTVHWRILKDPIRVAPHQMRELERLTAWRLNDNCQADTAGKPRQDTTDAVDVNRPLQSFHKLHRKVFCECKDWPSKFNGDREWCRNWKNRDPEQRLFNSPYNWPSDGFDFLQ